MGNVAKMLDEDIDVGMFKVKLRRGLEKLTAEPEGTKHRKHELHVSDFTASEKSFCYRKMILRYFKGEDKARGGSWVQWDGKFREEKWRAVFEAACILRGCQVELKLGPLVGHPDFLVDYGKGDTIVELTGHDSKIDEALRYSRLAVKKRQCLTYLIMRVKLVKGARRRGLVLVEDKGNNDFKVYPVDYDEEKATMLFGRVVRIARLIKAIEACGDDKERRNEIFRRVPKCGRKGCATCGH